MFLWSIKLMRCVAPVHRAGLVPTRGKAAIDSNKPCTIHRLKFLHGCF